MISYKRIFVGIVLLQVICTYRSFVANSHRLQEDQLRKIQIVVDKLERFVTDDGEQSGITDEDMIEAIKEIDGWETDGSQYETPKTLRCYQPDTYLAYQLILALETFKGDQIERIRRLGEYYKLLKPSLGNKRVFFSITQADATDDLVDSLSIGLFGQLAPTKEVVWRGLAEYEIYVSRFNEIGVDPKQIDRIIWLVDYLARHDVQILKKIIFPMINDPVSLTDTDVTMMRSAFTQSMFQLGFIMEDGRWSSIYEVC